MNKQTLGALCEFYFKARIKARRICIPIFLGMMAAAHSYAQQLCVQGMRIGGVITDPTGAVIPQARVQASSGATALTDATGHYMFACEPGTSITITADAAGFAKATAHAHARMGGVAHVNLKLYVARVETNVVVDANTSGVDSADTAGTTVLGTEEVRRLSDDPDDLLRELQAMAVGGGGVPGGAIITVNGFQNGSPLPPKGSIAEIRINPDPFSSQYERAPWIVPDIEITTKPGATAFHGALFFVESDSPWNATDPFSVTATPASKQRYGFELSGPAISRNSDFFSRSISATLKNSMWSMPRPSTADTIPSLSNKQWPRRSICGSALPAEIGRSLPKMPRPSRFRPTSAISTIRESGD